MELMPRADEMERTLNGGSMTIGPIGLMMPGRIFWMRQMAVQRLRRC